MVNTEPDPAKFWVDLEMLIWLDIQDFQCLAQSNL